MRIPRPSLTLAAFLAGFALTFTAGYQAGHTAATRAATARIQAVIDTVSIIGGVDPIGDAMPLRLDQDGALLVRMARPGEKAVGIRIIAGPGDSAIPYESAPTEPPSR